MKSLKRLSRFIRKSLQLIKSIRCRRDLKTSWRHSIHPTDQIRFREKILTSLDKEIRENPSEIKQSSASYISWRLKWGWKILLINKRKRRRGGKEENSLVFNKTNSWGKMAKSRMKNAKLMNVAIEVGGKAIKYC